MWERVLQALIRDRDNEYSLIDSSIVRTHAQAATGKEGGFGRGFGAFPRRPEHQDSPGR